MLGVKVSYSERFPGYSGWDGHAHWGGRGHLCGVLEVVKRLDAGMWRARVRPTGARSCQVRGGDGLVTSVIRGIDVGLPLPLASGALDVTGWKPIPL